MEEVTECRQGSVPWEISDWLDFPYKYFSTVFGDTTKTLLDIACGENPQLKYLTPAWKSVTSADYEDRGPGVLQVDITDMPVVWLTEKFDTIYSFETLEHIALGKHDAVISNLLLRATDLVIIGSVNRKGPKFLGKHEIWKDGLNPFHVAEYTTDEWVLRFTKFGAKQSDFYHSAYLGGGQWTMLPGISEIGISNYVTLRV